MTTPVQFAAQALIRHGEYLIEGNQWGPAEQDAITWLASEAADVARCETAESVIAILADTGWWDPTTETDERARAVATDMGLQ